MIALSFNEINEALSGRLVLGDSGRTPDDTVSGQAQTDSREISDDQIFFARRGEFNDGHDFVAQAIERGAALIVVEREVDSRVPQIVVADATVALSDLAGEVVRRVQSGGNLQIVGITGSNGKTTTKNLIGAMASKLGNTVAAEKSFNNEVGGPLTAIRIQADTDYLISEMGASAEGEIARLVEMAPPNIGVVLSVGLAHAGEFGSIDATVRAKSEMVTGLHSTDVAVLNREDPRVAQMAELTSARVRWFGLTDASHVWAEEPHATINGTTFTLHIDDEFRPVAFPVLGEHHIMNALAAATVAIELGLDIDGIVEVLEATTRPAKWRMEVTRARDNITVINDAYNASPDSMTAALKTLALIAPPEGRTFAVLGAMSELGHLAGSEHDRIGILAVRLRLSQLVVVGNEARRVHISAINEGAWNDESIFFEQQDEALAYLVSELGPHDTVIVKSSNSAGLRHLGDRLVEALA